MPKHALVFGASGIQGWAIVNELLSSHNADTFSKVTALTNRELNQEFLLWPQSSRLRLVHGVDLNPASNDALEKQFKDKIRDIDSVTHVYFCAYQWIEDQASECTFNSQMLQNAISAVESLSPGLSFVVLPTGAKMYGMHLLKAGFPFKDKLPLSEDLPQLPEPHASRLLYTQQLAVLKRLAAGKSWTWCDIRPDMVVGFVPNNNPHCLPQLLGIYLTLYAQIEGRGSDVPFPGSIGPYGAKFVPASQDIIAKLCIFASLHPETMGGGSAFNVGDRQEATSWSRIWPTICSMFGLEGIGPQQNTTQPVAYIQKHRKEWDQITQENQLRPGFVDNKLLNPLILPFMTELMDFDRQLSLKKAHKAGFTDEVTDQEAWALSFKRFRDARVIP